MLLVAALGQPLAGVVFVLEGDLGLDGVRVDVDWRRARDRLEDKSASS